MFPPMRSEGPAKDARHWTSAADFRASESYHAGGHVELVCTPFHLRACRSRSVFRRICSPTESRYVDSAMPFLFRCPITGTEVQGFLAHETPSEDPNSFEPVTCLACGQVHLVNFKTGKVLDERSED